MRCLARVQQVFTIICSDRPVVMLTGTIHSCERFLMKQTLHTVLARNSLQCLHYQMIVINCHITLCIDRRKLVLCRCHFVVLCLRCYANFPEFFIDILHKSCNSLTNGSEIMIIQLLTFRRHCSKQCASCIDQVFSLHEFFSVHKEVLLLRSHGRNYFLSRCIAKETKKSQ